MKHKGTGRGVGYSGQQENSQFLKLMCSRRVHSGPLLVGTEHCNTGTLHKTGCLTEAVVQPSQFGPCKSSFRRIKLKNCLITHCLIYSTTNLEAM